MWYTMDAYQIRVGAFKTYDHNLTVFHIVILIGCIPNTNGCLPNTGAYQIRMGALTVLLAVLTKYGEATYE